MVDKADGQDGGSAEVTIRVKHQYSEPFNPIAVTFVGLSRVGSDVQLDLGQINIQVVTERLKQLRASGSRVPKELTVEMPVAVSAYLTPSAFLKLYKEVNRIYKSMKRSGHIQDDEKQETDEEE